MDNAAKSNITPAIIPIMRKRLLPDSGDFKGRTE
jgi:hypothetical protein